MTNQAVPDAGQARTAGVRNPGSLSFSARDLLNVAIFAVIYFVVVYAIAMLGIISPLVMLLTLPLAVVAGGIPYLLFMTRVRHAGMVTLFGTTVAILYLLSGQPWVSTLLTIAVSIVADLICRASGYRSTRAAIVGYTVFSLWFIGPMIPLLVNRAEYLSTPGMQMMGPEYVAAFDQVVSVTALAIYAVGTVVCGVLGGLLGAKLLGKHFEKAGLA